MTSHSHDEIQRLLDHPVLITHDSHAKLIRAQIFFIAVSTIFLSVTEIELAKNSSILGIQLDGLKIHHIYWISIFLLTYQIFHFVWASMEAAYEWRARLTALATGGWGGGGTQISHEDQENKIRQTTIYSYFTRVIKQDLLNLTESLSGINTENCGKKLDEVKKSLDSINSCLTSSRVSDALVRFDNWFIMFSKMQNYRWLLLEFMLPIALGFIAILLASIEIIYKS